MSKEANDIDEAIRLYRLAEGTANEEDALSNLYAVVARVRAASDRQCCGGRCRFCPVWRDAQ